MLNKDNNYNLKFNKYNLYDLQIRNHVPKLKVNNKNQVFIQYILLY